MEQKKIIGAIDIGSTKIRSILAIKESNKIQVIGIGEKKCSIIKQGQIINNELAIKNIVSVIEKAELVAGREVDSFYINVPANICRGTYSNGVIAVEKNLEVDLYDIERVMEISQSISIPPDRKIIHNIPLTFSIDGVIIEEPLGANGVRLETNVYLIDCLQSYLENFQKIFERTGYQIQDYINENIATAEAVLTPEEKKSGAVVLHIGHEKTSVIYYHQQSASFIDSINVGSYHVTKDLAYGLKTTEEVAEEIKLKHGVALESSIIDDEIIDFNLLSYQKTAKVSKKVVSRIIEARMEEIFALAQKSLNSAENFKELNNVLVLTGGGALLSNVDDLASKVFNDPCRIGTPLNLSGLDDKVETPSYATLLGLIHYAVMEKVEEKEEGTFSEKKPISKLKNYFKKFFT